jgi:tRNA modification GTPase
MSGATPRDGASAVDRGDTIVARATAPGRSAIAVVRISGPTAFSIAGDLLTPWPAAPRVATLVSVRDPRDGSRIDSVVATSYPAPRSYTGEDVLELSSHGGYAVPVALVDAIVARGARPALAGEFTRRALLNGKIDLVQAEAIGDLIDARSDAMRRAALVQLDGGLSRRVATLRDELIDLEALLAYDIDFPEEDHGPIPPARIEAAVDRALGSLDALLATAPAGALVRDGATVVIAGAPNVGKSSLFNALLGEARAIVTDVPGTTRDAIEATVDHGGWPLRLVDTAGLRTTGDALERMGIEVSERYLAKAEVVIACGDSAAGVASALAAVRSLADAPVVAARTKADLVSASDEMRVPNGTIAVSAETGEGLRPLLDAVARALADRHGAPSADLPLLTRTRHVTALRTARDELAAFQTAWRANELPATIAAVHVRSAVVALDELIGAVDVEDVLTRLFATFCVGK